MIITDMWANYIIAVQTTRSYMKDVAVQCNTEDPAATDSDVISVNEAVANVDVESDDMQMEADHSEFVSDGVRW